jgi:hypothetical protein
MNRNKYMLMLALLVSFSLQAQEKTIKKSFSDVTEINLSTASGDCQIVKSTGNKVEVELVYSYSDDVFEAILEQDGSVLELEEKFQRNTSNNGNSKWTLSVPDNMEIDINSGSGDIKAKSIVLKLKTNTGSGDITLDYASGQIKANTGSGEFSADSFDGNMKINTGSGDVDLTNSKGEFRVNLGSGDIEASKLTGEFSMNVGSGDINTKDIVLTGASSFNAGSGDVRITLDAALKNDISVNSGSGNAILDFNGVKVEGEFTMKANKKNGDISAPFEFDEVTEEDSGNQTIIKKTAKVGSSTVKIKVSTGSGRAVVEK